MKAVLLAVFLTGCGTTIVPNNCELISDLIYTTVEARDSGIPLEQIYGVIDTSITDDEMRGAFRTMADGLYAEPRYAGYHYVKIWRDRCYR